MAMAMDVTNWDEDAYRESVLRERETQCRTLFRSIFAPNANRNPNSIPDTVIAAASDGSVASYSLSSCLSSLVRSYPLLAVSSSLIFALYYVDTNLGSYS